MKRAIVLIIISFTLSCISYAQTQFEKNIKSVDIGYSLDNVKATAQDVLSGKEINISDERKENGLIVIFSCNTCPFVIKNIERTKEVLAFAASAGVGVVILNPNEAQRDKDDSFEAMAKYANENGYAAYYVDKNSDIANALGATRTPEIFYFDGQGKLVYKGAMDDSPAKPEEAEEKYLENAIKNTISGTQVSPQESKSVGCTIKRLK